MLYFIESFTESRRDEFLCCIVGAIVDSDHTLMNDQRQHWFLELIGQFKNAVYHSSVSAIHQVRNGEEIKSRISVGDVNILPVNHGNCHLVLHWSRENMHFTETWSLTLYHKQKGVGPRYSWKGFSSSGLFAALDNISLAEDVLRVF